MKKALISIREPRQSGYRIAQVSDNTFEVSADLFWVDCQDDLIADAKWFDPTDNSFKEFPVTQEENNIPLPAEE